MKKRKISFKIIVICILFLSSCDMSVSTTKENLDAIINVFQKDDIYTTLSNISPSRVNFTTVVTYRDKFEGYYVLNTTAIHLEYVQGVEDMYGSYNSTKNFYYKDAFKDGKTNPPEEIVFEIPIRFNNHVFYDQSGAEVEQLKGFEFYSEVVDLTKNPKLIKGYYGKETNDYFGKYENPNKESLNYLKKNKKIFKLDFEDSEIALGEIKVDYSHAENIVTRTLEIDEPQLNKGLSMAIFFSGFTSVNLITESEKNFKGEIK